MAWSEDVLIAAAPIGVFVTWSALRPRSIPILASMSDFALDRIGFHAFRILLVRLPPPSEYPVFRKRFPDLPFGARILWSMLILLFLISIPP
jgi:hypothetical protein